MTDDLHEVGLVTVADQDLRGNTFQLYHIAFNARDARDGDDE